MTRYKELPIDDSKGIEQFKVGDNVRVYANLPFGYQIDVTLKGLGESTVFWGNTEQESAHWRQCRKLVEEKPREFLYCFGHRRKVDGNACCIEDSQCEIVTVREVLSEEE